MQESIVTLSCVILLTCIGVMRAGPIFASEQAKESCPHAKGWKPSKEELDGILTRHRQWLEKSGKNENSEEGRANLCNANLSGAELNGAMLDKADLSDTQLASANLNRANLSEAKLYRARAYYAELNDANLFGANLDDANLLLAKLNNANLKTATLKRAFLLGAEMKNVDLNYAQLDNAYFPGADLIGASLQQGSVSGAVLAQSDLTNAKYAPVSRPPDPYVAGIKGLSTVTFEAGREDGLVQLRELLQKAGHRELEREATFAIESGKTKHAITEWHENRAGAIEGVFRKFAFEWTTGYGLYPAHALLIIVVVWALLVPIYAWSIWQEPRKVTGGSGIYRIWPKDRVEMREGMQPKLDNPAVVECLHGGYVSALGWAAYFSLLSTFQIGFREFSVGTWLSRAQPRNFVLESVGWVRTVSGLQSLLSVYLLAMWVLTYFGRPFQ